jgi:hypothetical protein
LALYGSSFVGTFFLFEKASLKSVDTALTSIPLPSGRTACFGLLNVLMRAIFSLVEVFRT